MDLNLIEMTNGYFVDTISSVIFEIKTFDAENV